MSAATQRWTTGQDRSFSASFEQFMRERMAGVRYIEEIADTGVAGTLNTLSHKLGRIPRGVQIVNQATDPTDGPAGWYREKTDADWTATAITLRFDKDNARILLEVF